MLTSQLPKTDSRQWLSLSNECRAATARELEPLRVTTVRLGASTSAAVLGIKKPSGEELLP
jgi:hypothetical protein